mmetsp:Transcript_4513/g.9709  ORF Transcript_4513/g.9709 Transcript_4513/m.9709 type:complete len:331 (+) Transcript_4513:397-1389(+)
MGLRDIALSAHATAAPTHALCFTSLMFDSSDLPPVRVRIRSSRNGVTSLPLTPCCSASLRARLMAASTSAPSAAADSGMGTPSTRPPPSCSWWEAAIIAAASPGVFTLHGALQPLCGVKKAGNSSVPYAATHTPCVSKYSSVRGMSRTDLAPAQMTATGVRASSVRSAEMSMLTSPPLCTPPMPPVTNTLMPASAASSIVADTVVAPSSRCDSTRGRSRLLTFLTAWPPRAMCSSWWRSRPMQGCPAMMAIVAGTAPFSDTTCSTSRAVCRLLGYGMPWLMIVLSRATTAFPARRAACTAGEMFRSSGVFIVVTMETGRWLAGWLFTITG